MNKPKFSDKDYIDFLIASPRAFSCTQAARVQPGQENTPPAHDAVTRLLYRLETDPDELWQEARTQVKLTRGILVIDDSTLDKPCGVKRCQAHGARAQCSPIGLALRAFLRLESHCFLAGISWFAAKTQIILDAIRAYIARPQYHLVRTA